jgi:hypothetical protein
MKSRRRVNSTVMRLIPCSGATLDFHRFDKEASAMNVLRIILLISFMAVTVMSQENSPQAARWPASCPVTVQPKEPFTAPAPYELDKHDFWLGTEKLWTPLRKSGQVWSWIPRPPGHEDDLGTKTFWASVNFDWKTEYPPELKVTGKRLDGDAPPLRARQATNAFPGPAAAMLVGVIVTSPGCWQITGEYKGEKLSYVVWVHAGPVE